MDLNVNAETIKLYKKTWDIVSNLQCGEAFVKEHKKLEV